MHQAHIYSIKMEPRKLPLFAAKERSKGFGLISLEPSDFGDNVRKPPQWLKIIAHLKDFLAPYSDLTRPAKVATTCAIYLIIP